MKGAFEKEGKIRTFAAFSFEADFISKLQRYCENIKKLLTNDELDALRFMSLKNAHLTLRFIGNVNAQEYEKLSGIMDSLDGRYDSIRLDFNEIGSFPKVLWIKPEDSLGLRELYAAFEKGLKGNGFEGDDKDFHPHLTLARSKADITSALPERLKYQSMVDLSAALSQLHLFKSELHNSGAVHTKLKSINLK